MTLLLIAMMIVNGAVVVYLWNAAEKSKARRLQNTALLESIIDELLESYRDKNERIKLAEEIKTQLKATKNKLNVDVLALQYEFLTVLSRNNLIE